MIRHVALAENPRIFDGFGLTKEIHDWMKEMIGGRCYDRTALIWTKRSKWLLVVNKSKSDLVSNDTVGDTYWLHFYFSEAKHATLFKLTWGGDAEL